MFFTISLLPQNFPEMDFKFTDDKRGIRTRRLFYPEPGNQIGDLRLNRYWHFLFWAVFLITKVTQILVLLFPR
jgi:hypothetical protein